MGYEFEYDSKLSMVGNYLVWEKTHGQIWQ